jgi:hypothetical protein
VGETGVGSKKIQLFDLNIWNKSPTSEGNICVVQDHLGELAKLRFFSSFRSSIHRHRHIPIIRVASQVRGALKVTTQYQPSVAPTNIS